MQLRLSFFFIFLLAGSAMAKTTSSTQYNYFKIQGQTAQQIHISLFKHAKGPGGHDAYATTSTRIFQKVSFIVGKTCSVKTYDMQAMFKINLPVLKSSNPSPLVKAKWAGFADVLRLHEEHHRSLWLACAQKFNQKVQSLSAPNCQALNKKFISLWKTMETDCKKQNAAFDRAEQLRFPKLPFIKMVSGGR